MKHFIAHWLFGFVLVVLATAYAGEAVPQLGIVGGFGWWLTSCQIWRWRPCTGRCKGKGKLTDPADATYWRDCPDCGGRGRQYRWFCFRKEG